MSSEKCAEDELWKVKGKRMNLEIKSKITIIICAVTIIFASISIYTANRMQETAQNIYDHPYTSSNSARGMRSRLLDMKRFVSIFLTYDFKGEQNVRSIFQERYDLQFSDIERLYSCYSGPKEDVDTLQAAMNQLIAQQDKAVDFVVGHTENEISNYLALYVYPQYDRVSDCLTTIIDFADDKVCELTETSKHTAVLTVSVSLLLSIGIILLSIYSEYMDKKNLKLLSIQEQELKDALNNAQKAFKVKKEFLSCMSHEIRTPLSIIIGMTKIAATHLDDSNRIEDCLSKITFSSRHLMTIINDVLDMSKIEEGKLSVNHEPFQLQQLLEPLVATIYAQAEEQGLKFECGIKNIPEAVYIGDCMRINQILLNLLSNSIKFTPKGGVVHLEVNPAPVVDGKTHLRFITKDTGIGMSDEYLKRIFKPFEQADSGTSRKYGGTGLGMAITYNLVKLLGGSIQVESKLGEGTTCTVVLPVDVPNEGKHKKWEWEPLKVLVADPDEDNCNYASMLLNRMGIHADCVSEGHEALQRVFNAHKALQDYDICMIDWKMSNVDGIEVIRCIREKIGPKKPDIIISTYNWAEIEDKARSDGANAFILKPLFESSLYDILVSLTKNILSQEPEQISQFIPPEFPGRHFLLVEDNILNREIAMEILKVTGAEIDCAENGKEALDIFLASPGGYYDLILMDIQMPVIDGYEATKQLRASSHPDAERVPVIAMTANAFKEDVEHALAAGMNGHLAKPINVEIFYDTLVSKLR